MTEEEMKREKLYEVTMSHARKMLSEGLITEEQYGIFDAKCRRSTGQFSAHYSPTFA